MLFYGLDTIIGINKLLYDIYLYLVVKNGRVVLI